MHSKYLIKNTKFIEPSKDYFSDKTYPIFQEKLLEFKSELKSDIDLGKTKTYYKFGDGDYYFLKKEKRGSAKPGRRALKKPYYLINHKKFVTESQKNDIYMSLIQRTNSKMFKELFNKDFDYPSEFAYGLLSNKWLLQSVTDNIGLIGADKKIELIFELMKKKEYQNYLGVESFAEYITIPQLFACDNLNKTIKNVKKQISKSNTKFYLVGVGHVKSGLLSELKQFTNAVFLDVGVGIDALAGIINLSRPYFGNWQNFQFRNKTIYKEIDFLVNKINNVKNVNLID